MMRFTIDALCTPVDAAKLDGQYGIVAVLLVIREIRIDEAAGRGHSDSRMTSSEVIMPLKLQSTKY